jgi:hypothetical protein
MGHLASITCDRDDVSAEMPEAIAALVEGFDEYPHIEFFNAVLAARAKTGSRHATS